MFPTQDPVGTTVVSDHPYEVVEQATVWIPMSDGTRLAGRIWRPAVSSESAVPAILEAVPYRRRDGTLGVDQRIHPFYAGHGFACVRVDLRGSGDSEGLLVDEYLPLEQDDILETIEWISHQPWCNGNIGMTGLSWGGFNSLQVAARAPEKLKAVVCVGATVDRYNDDVHYKNGCLLNENFVWGSTLMSFQTRPPDPQVVGERWRSMWLARLKGLSFYPETWIVHQLRDSYWRHGSVCEDYGAIKAAVMIVSGWADLYVNAVPALLAHLSSPRRAVSGPWGHQFPHLATPGPPLDYLREALRWWRTWLLESPEENVSPPLYLAYLQEGIGRPDPFATEVPGTWIEESEWPSPSIDYRGFYLTGSGLSDTEQTAPELSIHSPLDTGTGSGEWVPHCFGPEMPRDQRDDDGGSLVFDSPQLPTGVDILGDPVVELTLRSDAPTGNLIARLCDVAPDGTSTRVCVGVLSLCQRNGNTRIEPMPLHQQVSVRIRLDHVGHRFPPGHRVRLALSTAYWPAVWPAADNPVLTLAPAPARLLLPVRSATDRARVHVDAARVPPAADIRFLRPPRNERKVNKDLATGRSRVDIVDDYGEQKITEHGLISSGLKQESYTIHREDPSSAACDVRWRHELQRHGWRVRTDTTARLTCDVENYYLEATVTAHEDERQVFKKTFSRSIKRL